MTPGGILIFFPSYRTLENAFEAWQQCGIISKIEQHKSLFKEPKNSDLYQKTMQAYYNNIFEGERRGAILMGVCRGRISEGLDFTDDAARLVMIVGIPYPMLTDPKVILKKNYLDSRSVMPGAPQHVKNFNGKLWYNQQATRAVNQAIGRVIRHVQDYGAIVLADERYSWGTNKQGISAWLRDNIFWANGWEKYEMRTKAFFQ